MAMSLMGDGLLANLMAMGLSWAMFFFHVEHGGCAVFKGVSEESDFEVLGLCDCGGVEQ